MLNSEALNAAADHIQVFGHRKHGLGSHGQPTCALGAFKAVCDGREWTRPAIELMHYIGNLDVAAWNNAPERTANDVITAMRACALIEATREEQDAAWQTYVDVVSA